MWDMAISTVLMGRPDGVHSSSLASSHNIREPQRAFQASVETTSQYTPASPEGRVCFQHLREVIYFVAGGKLPKPSSALETGREMGCPWVSLKLVKTSGVLSLASGYSLIPPSLLKVNIPFLSNVYSVHHS